MNVTVKRLVDDMRARKHSTEGALGADYRAVREFNRALVLNYIREHGPLARVAIAQRTGLSRTTVSSIMDVLLEDGLVREGETVNAAPAGGRRAILVHFDADAGRVLGVDVGRTHLTLILTNLAAQMIAQRSGPFDADRGPDLCLPLLVEEVRSFVAEQGVAWEHLIGIGVGIPGTLDVAHHRLVAPPRMPGWSGVDPGAHLQQELGVPVYADNDANLGALGESRYGAGSGVAHLAYIKIGTGIGCGLVMHGRVYRGSAGFAGEFGHLTVDEDGPVCGCGNRGCLEMMAGAKVIVADACAAPAGALAGRDPHTVDIAEVIGAAREGDSACRAALEHAAGHVGVALGGLINLINPTLILVDGGVARAGDLFLEPLERVTAARSLPAAWAQTRIGTGELGAYAIALGAVTTVIDAAFAVPGMATTEFEGPLVAALSP